MSAAACLPSFEEVECYADVDCPGGLVCGDDNRCVSDQPIRDAGSKDPRDGGPVDDRDGGPMTRDGGPPVVDGGTRDGGFDVRITPASIDFGLFALGCPAQTRRVAIENLLPTPVQIDNILFTQGTSGEFTVKSPIVPFNVVSIARILDVNYEATNNGLDQGALQITYAGGSERIDVALSGTGASNPEVRDTFTSTAGPIDILFVVDNAMSMGALQQRLSNRLLFLFLTLDFEGWDYRIAVTTMDTSAGGSAGRIIGVPSVITPQTANRQALLEARIQVGSTGPPERRAFDAVERALTSPLIDTDNAGFYRPSAPLLVIHFGAQDDVSNGTVANHVQFLAALKAASMAPVLANVITPAPTFCGLKGGAVGERGQRFIDLGTSINGAVSDMCGNDWDGALDTFPAVEPPRVFRLAQPAVAGTITVQVEGTVVPANGGSNWRYDAPTQSIVFEPVATPVLGDDIEVRYEPAC